VDPLVRGWRLVDELGELRGNEAGAAESGGGASGVNLDRAGQSGLHKGKEWAVVPQVLERDDFLSAISGVGKEVGAFTG